MALKKLDHHNKLHRKYSIFGPPE